MRIGGAGTALLSFTLEDPAGGTVDQRTFGTIFLSDKLQAPGVPALAEPFSTVGKLYFARTSSSTPLAAATRAAS